ncbi:MAG: hypothetical protein J6E48_05900 [Prevotella sp.]|nr:hypothetical protein [Prevotella sp.]
MKYGLATVMRKIPEFNQLKKTNPRYSAALKPYDYKTVKEFIYDYENKGLKGKKVYDELIKLIVPEKLKTEPVVPADRIKVKTSEPERYSMEDLLTHEDRVLPYVSNIHQSIGKLMDVAISQAINITEIAHKKNGRALRMFFYEHLPYEEICNHISCTKEHVRNNLIGKFIFGEQYVEDISLSEDFKKGVKELVSPLLYQVCDIAFEDNDIDTPEKAKFAAALSGYKLLDDVKEWGKMMILTRDSYIAITRQHLISLKKAICEAIVPISLSALCDETKADFIKKHSPCDFNRQIIEQFVKSNPWIETDDEGRYYIKTAYLDSVYQRQGRIIYESGGLIHHNEVRAQYRSLYGEDYNTPGIQNSLSKRIQNDFFPYGRTGLWYYSEDGVTLKPVNKVVAKFVDDNISFYWKDLVGVVGQLCRLNRNYSVRRIRVEITNLCYVDSNDANHFVKKGEESNYSNFTWLKGKQNRTNWAVNHTIEILNDAPNKEMKWEEFANIFKQDLQETGRPLKVLEDVKYKHSGTTDDRRIFIRENDTIKINEDVVQNDYNGDLSLYGLYRKNPEFYNVIFSLAVTELRKRESHKMPLIDFINFALERIKGDGESEGIIDATFIRKRFEINSELPKGLSRINENGSVYIKLNIDETVEDTKDDIQYEIVSAPSTEKELAPQLVVSQNNREAVSYTSIFNWEDVKTALQKDLTFYNRPEWYEGITSDRVLNKFETVLAGSDNYNLNHIVPQIIYEFHYARTDRYDLNQYMLNLPIAFEALLREIYESAHRPIRVNGIYELCKEGFNDYAAAITSRDKRGFGRILNDLVHKRNLLLHGANLELSIVTLVQNIVEYIALFVYTVDKYALDVE